MSGIKWIISSLIYGYQRRNRVGRIGYILCTLGIVGMFQRFFMQTPPGAFGGTVALFFTVGIIFSFIGWCLSILYPQRRL